MMRLISLFLAWLGLAGAIIDAKVVPKKFLVIQSGISRSHLQFSGVLVDTLVRRGHTVVGFLASVRNCAVIHEFRQ